MELNPVQVVTFAYQHHKDACRFGAEEHELSPLEFCGANFKCDFPATLCRVNRFDDSTDCWLSTFYWHECTWTNCSTPTAVGDECLEALRNDHTTPTPTTTTPSPQDENAIGSELPADDFDYIKAANDIELHPEECTYAFEVSR